MRKTDPADNRECDRQRELRRELAPRMEPDCCGRMRWIADRSLVTKVTLRAMGLPVVGGRP